MSLQTQTSSMSDQSGILLRRASYTWSCFENLCKEKLQLLIRAGTTSFEYIRKHASFIYLWKPTSSLSIGHISLLLPNGVYISFYPMEQSRIHIRVNVCPSKLYKDVADEKEYLGQEPIAVIPVFGLDIAAITNWWTSVVTSKPTYDLNALNCATVVFTALCKGLDWFVKKTGNCINTLISETQQLITRACMTPFECIRKRASVLYLWKSASWLGLGHISLLLSNGVYISFYPREASIIRICVDDACPAKMYGSVAEEKEYLGKEPIEEIPIFGLDVASITNWWTSFATSKPTYDLKERNCATVVFTALCKGSDWFVRNTGNCIQVPETVFQYVQKGFLEGKKISCGATCVNCFKSTPYKVLGCMCRQLYRTIMKPF